MTTILEDNFDGASGSSLMDHLPDAKFDSTARWGIEYDGSLAGGTDLRLDGSGNAYNVYAGGGGDYGPYLAFGAYTPDAGTSADEDPSFPYDIDATIDFTFTVDTVDTFAGLSFGFTAAAGAGRGDMAIGISPSKVALQGNGYPFTETALPTAVGQTRRMRVVQSGMSLALYVDDVPIQSGTTDLYMQARNIRINLTNATCASLKVVGAGGSLPSALWTDYQNTYEVI